MSEPLSMGEGEGYGACFDEAAAPALSSWRARHFPVLSACRISKIDKLPPAGVFCNDTKDTKKSQGA